MFSFRVCVHVICRVDASILHFFVIAFVEGWGVSRGEVSNKLFGFRDPYSVLFYDNYFMLGGQRVFLEPCSSNIVNVFVFCVAACVFYLSNFRQTT